MKNNLRPWRPAGSRNPTRTLSQLIYKPALLVAKLLKTGARAWP
jgi:hypothetical protein